MKQCIAMYLPSLHGGGAERVMVTLANGFARRGYNVDLVLAQAAGPYLNDVSDTVRIVNLQASRVIGSFPALVRYLRREAPAALLSAMNHANVVALLARLVAQTGTRLVVSERNTTSVEARGAKNINAKIVYGLIPMLYRWADGIVAVSRDAADDLQRYARLPPGSVQVIYNPIDINRIRKLAGEPPSHPWLQPGQPPVVLGIGRLVEQKNFSLLLHAFARIRVQCSARLIILGEGEQRPALEKEITQLGIENDVDLPGFTKNPYTYLSRCAVFVLSSNFEGLPGVLIEALACNAPVVATACPSGPSEILENGKWGVLVPVGNMEVLARAVLAVIEKPRGALPAVQTRAHDFQQERAVSQYLHLLFS